MTDTPATVRSATGLRLAGWTVVLVLATLLAIDTMMTIANVGLVGDRPPLSAVQTGIRITLGIAALGIFAIWRDAWVRVTCVVAAFAAGSSTLFGFGVRSPALSAFRLLSHLAMFVLAAVVAGRMLALARSKRIR